MSKTKSSKIAPKRSVKLNATPSQITAAFTEWDRRYREEPERFMSEAQHLLRETSESYGAACTPYFLKILGEIQAS